jgi:indole-3-glycerol phosphate synthase
MNILERIVAVKKAETEARKKICPVKELERSAFFDKPVLSFFDSLNKKEPSVIAEFKRKSPSKGIINNNADVIKVASGYFRAGMAAMSVLTDKEFFGGSAADLEQVAKLSILPVLRKEFIIDEYQVIESKAIGASSILLIGAILSISESNKLSSLAKSIGIDVLFEIHDESDLKKMGRDIRVVGVNNRDLKSFDIDMDNSLRLLKKIPLDCLKVAESGFQTVNDVMDMYSHGYDAFLIGERFMRSEDPSVSANEFMKDLKSQWI